MESNCIIWKGALDSHGYGQTWKYNKPFKAHRDAYEQANNLILKTEEFVLHKCDTPSCINPEHLYLGTQLDNMRDRKERTGYIQPKGEKHYASKLTSEDILYILSSDKTNKELAEELKVDPSNISRIRNRLRWKHVNSYQLQLR